MVNLSKVTADQVKGLQSSPKVVNLSYVTADKAKGLQSEIKVIEEEIQ